MSIKIKYKTKQKKSNKKLKLCIYKYISFFAIIVFNNFLKRLQHLTCHLNAFCSQHMVPLKNTSRYMQLTSWVSKSVILLIDFIGLLNSSMASNNFLAMDVEFSFSDRGRVI